MLLIGMQWAIDVAMAVAMAGQRQLITANMNLNEEAFTLFHSHQTDVVGWWLTCALRSYTCIVHSATTTDNIAVDDMVAGQFDSWQQHHRSTRKLLKLSSTHQTLIQVDVHRDHPAVSENEKRIERNCAGRRRRAWSKFETKWNWKENATDDCIWIHVCNAWMGSVFGRRGNCVIRHIIRCLNRNKLRLASTNTVRIVCVSSFESEILFDWKDAAIADKLTEADSILFSITINVIWARWSIHHYYYSVLQSKWRRRNHSAVIVELIEK